jgi:hypothetical protein
MNPHIHGFFLANVLNLVGKVYPCVKVSNYLNSLVYGHGKLVSGEGNMP